MTFWALRVAVLGRGPWLLIRDERQLERLCNSPRRRRLASHDLNEQTPLVNSSIDLKTKESFREGRCRVGLRAHTFPAEERLRGPASLIS
jgi:hypothetical protein